MIAIALKLILRLAIGFFIAMICVALELLLSLPYGGGGGSLLVLAWISMIGSVFWAIGTVVDRRKGDGTLLLGSPRDGE